MPDITMCLNNQCPSREHCYRYRAVPSHFTQVYAAFMVVEGRDRCNSYWPMRDDIARRVVTHARSASAKVKAADIANTRA